MTHSNARPPEPVCIFGLWHLGLVTAVGLADLGYRIIGFDRDVGLINNLQQGKPPLYEPDLERSMLFHLKSSRLRFDVNYQLAVPKAEVVLITYDTPVDDQDQVNLTPIEETIQTIAPLLNSNALLIINSQVPVGSCERWQKLISGKRPDANIDLVYSPENLKLGQGIELFKHPDMVIIGHSAASGRKKAERFYKPFDSEKFYVSLRTAEMTKHALNAFFATNISFANELGSLCDAVGADGVTIAKILRRDRRIGKHAQVRPGLGFAGATLARDLKCLQNLGKETGTQTDLVDSVLKINQRQVQLVVRMVEQYFEGDLKNRTISVFGLTYKPGTSTLRRSAAIEIIQALHDKQVRIKAHDPKAHLPEPSDELAFDFFRNPYETVRGSSGILVLTEWPEFKDLDYTQIKHLMSHPLILDAKNYLDGDHLRRLGFTYLEIGRGQFAEVKTL